MKNQILFQLFVINARCKTLLSEKSQKDLQVKIVYEFHELNFSFFFFLKLLE